MAEAGSLLAAPIAVDWKVSEKTGGWGLETAFGKIDEQVDWAVDGDLFLFLNFHLIFPL